jgi:hypothetical protein
MPDQPQSGSPAPRPEIGARFNPWDRWDKKLMPYPPATVWRQPGLDLGIKALYMQLFYCAGEKGFCYPATETLAADLGVTEKSIDRWLAALESHRLVCHEKRAGHRSNTYYFLWHGIFEGTTLSRQRKPKKAKCPFVKGHKTPFEGTQNRFDGTTLSQESLNLRISPLNQAGAVAAPEFVEESAPESETRGAVPACPAMPSEKTKPNEEAIGLSDLQYAIKGAIHRQVTPDQAIEMAKFGREHHPGLAPLQEFFQQVMAKKRTNGYEFRSWSEVKAMVGQEYGAWLQKQGLMPAAAILPGLTEEGGGARP